MTSEDYKKTLFGERKGSDGIETDFIETDPELADLFSAFAAQEIPGDVDVPAEEADLAILASLMGTGALDVFNRMMDVVHEDRIDPLKIREMIYQGTAYLGIGRVLPFLDAFDRKLRELSGGSTPPLEKTGVTTAEDRVERGEDVQVEAFGPQMRGFSSSGGDMQHINKWLSGNCFGDYYTRGGLDLRLREMCTCCFLAGLGGCDPQLTSHAVANMRVGNNKTYLIGIISVCVPYIGYPRALNAVRCISQAAVQYEDALRRELQAAAGGEAK